MPSLEILLLVSLVGSVEKMVDITQWRAAMDVGVCFVVSSSLYIPLFLQIIVNYLGQFWDYTVVCAAVVGVVAG